MSDKNLNKNTFFENFLSSNDENKVDGVQINKVKNSIINILQNNNMTDLALLLANIIVKMNNLKTIVDKNIKKKNKYANFIPLQLREVYIDRKIHSICKNNKKVKIIYDIDILKQYQYCYDMRYVNYQLVKAMFTPKCIIFVEQNYFNSEFKNLITDIKDFKYY